MLDRFTTNSLLVRYIYAHGCKGFNKNLNLFLLNGYNRSSYKMNNMNKPTKTHRFGRDRIF